MKSQSSNVLTRFIHFIETDSEPQLVRIVQLIRLVFILFMVIYLALGIFSISTKLVNFVAAQGALDFLAIKTLLTDALFMLIVLAIVKALFIKSSFEYALTFLEIAFVVVIRKLILLDTIPEENMTLLILGVISSILFFLIIYMQILLRRWKMEERQLEALKTKGLLE